MNARPTAMIADDEPLLRGALQRLLLQAWPELELVAEARNGREAIELFEAHQPTVCFLDVHMPGMNGIEAARRIGARAHVVFVTAHDQYAVEAFNHDALDYLVKPVTPQRLSETVARIQRRMQQLQPAHNTDMLLEKLASRLLRTEQAAAPQSLRWLRASIGLTIQLIPVEDIDFLRTQEKYTLIAWRDSAGQAREAAIRTPLKQIMAQLDPLQFVQAHRSVGVNLRAIAHITRSGSETADIHVKGRSDVLPVSRTYLHLFRQM